jgi:ATP-dependent Clp protease ATP-binding subunit ClpA
LQVTRESEKSALLESAIQIFEPILVEYMNSHNPKSAGFPIISMTEVVYLNLLTIVKEELKDTCRPEFLNCIDESFVFSPLGNSDLGKIVSFLLQQAVYSAKTEQNMKLIVDPALSMCVLDKGSTQASQFGFWSIHCTVKQF